MPFAAIWMDLEIIILSESRQEQIYDTAYIWILKKNIQTNLSTNQKQTHRHREKAYGNQRGR